MTDQNSNFKTPTISGYRRGEIRMVDFGHSIGTEPGMEHPQFRDSIAAWAF